MEDLKGNICFQNEAEVATDGVRLLRAPQNRTWTDGLNSSVSFQAACCR
uniref:Uncharacterized protein n=1 Tax=Anguilla anguilla TaxID=7936 RepID=A0A0E9VGK7_ANGAN